MHFRKPRKQAACMQNISIPSINMDVSVSKTVCCQIDMLQDAALVLTAVQVPAVISSENRVLLIGMTLLIDSMRLLMSAAVAASVHAPLYLTTSWVLAVAMLAVPVETA
jgi:hypothetical protein